MVGVCTKLKYQSKPIHMTPLMMWSQRNANSHHSCVTNMMFPLSLQAENARMRKWATRARTNPIATVCPSESNGFFIPTSFCNYALKR